MHARVVPRDIIIIQLSFYNTTCCIVPRLRLLYDFMLQRSKIRDYDNKHMQEHLLRVGVSNNLNVYKKNVGIEIDWFNV